MSVLTGVAVEDATPHWPVQMSGFAARHNLSAGAHDPITVRALAIDSTCIISIDVVGLDEQACDRIRDAAPFPRDNVVVSATHTHGGPAVMLGGLGRVDEEARALVIDAAIRAACRAAESRRPSDLEYVDAGALPVATDRRHGGRPASARLQALRWQDEHDSVLAVLVVYPCHPVVLGADNDRLTADYPAALRARIEERSPGAVAIFLSGCAGDINVGHEATASYSAEPDRSRTFEESSRIGRLLGDALAEGSWAPVAAGPVASSTEPIELEMVPLDREPPDRLAERWRGMLPRAQAGEAAVLEEWIAWAGRPSAGVSSVWAGSVTVFRWGVTTLVFLPGEPFLRSGERIADGSRAIGCVVVGYSNGCPGYLPTADAYSEGQYEVTDAHRYYGMPAPFARGSAEALEDLARRLVDRLEAIRAD